MSQFLPVTVIAAILIFLLKEGLEALRRSKARARQRTVLRKLICIEIERNHWAAKSLRSAIDALDDAASKGQEMTISSDAVGRYRLRTFQDGQMLEGQTLARIHTDMIDKNLVLLADIDQPNFETVLSLKDGLAELDHVRNSFIAYISEPNAPEGFGQPAFRESFADYAKTEIADSLDELQSAYLKLSGTPLTEHRLR